jgi:hypothetical protein
MVMPLNVSYIPEGTEHSTADIVTSTRIGIQGAGPEWAQLPLRFVWFLFHVSENSGMLI